MELDANDNGTAALERVLEQTKMVYIPVICVLGLFGNCLGLTLIWTDTKLKRIASNYHLSALAVSASAFLICLLLLWTELVFDIPIYQKSLGCKLFTFTSHCSDFVVNWSITLLSFERVVILYRVPCIYKQSADGRSVESKRRCLARWQILVLLGSAALLHAWIIHVASLKQFIDPLDGVPKFYCAVSDEYKTLYIVMSMVEVIVTYSTPSVLISIFTLAAIHRYRQCIPKQSRVRFQRGSAETGDLPAGTLTQRTAAAGTPHLAVPLVSMKASEQVSAAATSTASGHSLTFSASEYRLSRTLITLSALFVLLILPQNVVRMIQAFEYYPEFHKPVWLLLVDYVAWFSYYMHYAIMFYLYIFWTPKMRKLVRPTAMKMLECYCMKPTFESSVEM